MVVNFVLRRRVSTAFSKYTHLVINIKAKVSYLMLVHVVNESSRLESMEASKTVRFLSDFNSLVALFPVYKTEDSWLFDLVVGLTCD